MKEILLIAACGYLASQIVSPYPDPPAISYNTNLVKMAPLSVANSRVYYEDRSKNTPVRGFKVGTLPSSATAGRDRVIYNVGGALVEGTSKMG